MKTTDKAEIRFLEFKPGETAEVKVTAAVKLRGPDVELKGEPLQAGFQQNADGLTVEMAANGRPMSEVVIRRHTGSGVIDVFERPRLQETARSIGRTIGRAVGDEESAVAEVGARPEVSRAVESGGNIYVEPRDARGTWIRYAPEGDPRVNIADGVDMRVGFRSGGSGDDSRWNVTFIDSNTAQKEISGGGRYLVAEDSPGGRPDVAFSVMGRGPPPPPGKRVIVDFGDVPPEKRDVLAKIGGGSNGRWPNAPNGDGGGEGGASFGPEDVARKATDDPNGLLLWIERSRTAKLERADKLIDQGKFEQAARELDDLDSFIPNDPEILLRRAIAKVGSHATDRAAAAAALKLDPARMPEFAARLDAATQYVTGSGAEDLRALFVGAAAKSKGKQVHYFFKRNDSMGAAVEILNISNGREVAAGTGDLRYTLATMDTAPPGKVVHPTPPPSKPLEIHDDVIAGLAPDRIYDASGHLYDRVADSALEPRTDISFGGGPPNGYQNLWKTYSGCDSLSKEERARHSECRSTVVIDGGGRNTRAAL